MVATYKGRELVDCKDFSPSVLSFVCNKRGDKTAESWICLDTETSNNHDEENLVGWIYQWCFSYGNQLVYGRKPSQLVEALKKIIKVNGLGTWKVWGKEDEYFSKRVVVYVHNLAYDYEYFKMWVKEAFPSAIEKLIAVGTHKVLVWEIGGLQFRCSYKLSQKSLEAWGRELNIHHRKMVGAIDYDTVRYQDTPLNKDDWHYMFTDVIALDECITTQMAIHNDDIMSIPYTITGYVRRDARAEFKKDKGERPKFKKTRLYSDTYDMCRKEFAGGLTHGNRFLAGKTIKGKIRHRDFASHYPSQQRFYEAPKSGFILYFNAETDKEMSMQDLITLCSKRCILAAITITKLTVKKGVTLPYAQTYKFIEGRNIKLKDTNIIDDNGRILKYEGSTCIIVNEYDLKWLIKQYEGIEYRIEKVYTAIRGEFPKYLQKTVDNYFTGKTVLKNKCKKLLKEGFTEDSVEYREAYRDLMIVKGKLNGIYGMSATDPVRVEYEDSIITGEWTKKGMTEQERAEALTDYYNSNSNFMAYQLGVWTTALARNELLEFVELIGYENFLYADTDSIFYISTPEIEKKIEDRNAYFRAECDRRGVYVDVEGKRVYYNQFEDEEEDIVAFRFLHSKCYAYIVNTEEGEELHTTIAGVAKHGRRGMTRVKELGSIDELKHGKQFVDCGGTQCKYIPHQAETVYIDGHLTEIACSAIICNTMKTLRGEISREENRYKWSVEI